jgi:hypothetical protein
VDGVARALARSLLGQASEAAAALDRLAALGPLPTKRKAGPPWFRALLDVANTCLLGAPTDLGPKLRALAERTQDYFGADFEDQNFEPCFGTAALALVARARDRGFDVSGPDPHTSLPLELLRLRRGALPKHPWYDWPSPDAAFEERVVEAFQAEGAAKPAKAAAAGRARAPAKAAKTPKKKRR